MSNGSLTANQKIDIQTTYRMEVKKQKVVLEIEEASECFANDAPALADVILTQVDAVLLVFSHKNEETFQKVAELRDMVRQKCGKEKKILVIGNKMELASRKNRVMMDLLVSCDWEESYMECSAKRNEKVEEIINVLLSKLRGNSDTQRKVKNIARRRLSLPAIPKKYHRTRIIERRDSISTVMENLWKKK